MLGYVSIALALIASTTAQTISGTPASATATVNSSDGGDSTVSTSSICTPNGFDSCSTTPFTSTTFTSFVSPSAIATSESAPSATTTLITESSSFTSSFPSSSAFTQNSTSDAVSTFASNITNSVITTTNFGTATGTAVLGNFTATTSGIDEATSTSHKSSTALIAGLTIGLIVLLAFALLGTLFLCVRSKRRKERRKTEIRSRAWTAVHAPSQAAPSTYAEDDDRSLYQNASSESCYSEPSAMTSEDPFLSSPIGSSTAPSPTTETMSHNNSPVTIREVWHHDGGPVRLIEHPPAYQTLSMVDRARHPASIYPAMVRAQKEGQGRLRIVT